MRLSLRLLAAATISLVVAACGDSNPTSPSGNKSMTASIDGSAWNGALSIQASHNSNVLAIGGVDAQSRQILITIPNVTAAGTYQLGFGQSGIATVSVVAQVWTSSLVGGGGSVVVSTLTATRAAGTFTISAPASTSTGATGIKQITSGTFDVTF